MREVNLTEISQLASNAREAIWSKARNLGREPKVYLHWTAGRYHQKFDDYHVNIDGDGRLFVSTENFAETLNGTWKRNTGAINISLCCAVNADTHDLGPEPPTPAQIEAIAQVIVEVCDNLWLTIDKGHVMTHGEAAANEDGLYLHPRYSTWVDDIGDGNVRWDLEYLETEESPKYNPWATDGSRGGDVLRGKAIFYHNKKHEKF